MTTTTTVAPIPTTVTIATEATTAMTTIAAVLVPPSPDSSPPPVEPDPAPGPSGSKVMVRSGYSPICILTPRISPFPGLNEAVSEPPPASIEPMSVRDPVSCLYL